MKYGATPLIRMLGPKRRTSGATPFALSVPGGVPGPDSPGPETCSATRRTGRASPSRGWRVVRTGGVAALVVSEAGVGLSSTLTSSPLAQS